MAKCRAKLIEIWDWGGCNNRKQMDYLNFFLTSVQCYLGVIWCTCLKIACNWKKVDCKVKGVELGNNIYWVYWPVILKWLVIERNGLKLGHGNTYTYMGYTFDLITSVKEVMFLLRLVCVCVCVINITQKVTDQFLRKLWEGSGAGQGTID